MPFNINKEFKINKDMLNLRSFQEEIIASNIANAGTKNYKARKINFQKEMKNIIDRNSKSNNIHINEKFNLEKSKYYSIPHVYTVKKANSINGNTVNMDEERINLIKNSLKYQEEIILLNNKIKNILLVLQE